MPISQQVRNQGAINLLESWLRGPSDYDKEVWPIIDRALREEGSDDE